MENLFKLVGVIAKVTRDVVLEIRNITSVYSASICRTVTNLTTRAFHSMKNIESVPNGKEVLHQPENVPMKGLNLRHIFILAQSFAFFVALSTFMGRIYFLTYYDNLNIPPSEKRLNPLDYALVSPDVTILGIGMTLLVVMIWLVRMPRAKTWHWTIILVGLIVAGAGYFIEYYRPYQHAQSVWPGYIGIREFLSNGLILLGSYVTFSGVQSTSDLISNTDNVAKSRTLKIFIMLLFFVAFFLAAYALSLSAADIAETNAKLTLEDAPQVQIEFTDSISGTLLDDGSGMCNVDANTCSFELILLGEQSVYVQPIASEVAADQRSHFSFPIEDVARIAYSAITPDN